VNVCSETLACEDVTLPGYVVNVPEGTPTVAPVSLPFTITRADKIPEPARIPNTLTETVTTSHPCTWGTVTVTLSAHEVDKTSPNVLLPDPTNGTAFADTILNARAASD